MAEHEPEPMITAKQAAAILGLSYKKTLELAEAHKIPGMRLGWVWKFRKSALDVWINQQMQESVK